jgi:hypothetical protein
MEEETVPLAELAVVEPLTFGLEVRHLAAVWLLAAAAPAAVGTVAREWAVVMAAVLEPLEMEISATP